MRLVPVIILTLFFFTNAFSADRLSSFNNKGLESLRGGLYESAVMFFTKAIDSNRALDYLYNNRAAAYMKLKKYDQAKKDLEKSISLNPNNVKALSNMAIVMFHLKNYVKSYYYYSHVKKIAPSYTSKRFEKKRVKAKLKKMSENDPENSDLKKIIRRMESE